MRYILYSEIPPFESQVFGSGICESPCFVYILQENLPIGTYIAITITTTFTIATGIIADIDWRNSTGWQCRGLFHPINNIYGVALLIDCYLEIVTIFYELCAELQPLPLIGIQERCAWNL